jgi:hypothetical protein
MIELNGLSVQIYRKKQCNQVTAVQINLDTQGLAYTKWGSAQCGKANDWLVNNGGDVYTIDDVSFQATYRQQSLGVYVKVANVQAVAMSVAGVVKTKEGETHYQAGDYIVRNGTGPLDMYAVPQNHFEDMYEVVT